MPTLSNKLTPEELAAQIQAGLDADPADDPQPTPDPTPDPVPDDPTPQPSITPDDEDEPGDEDPTPDPTPTPEKKDEDPDYKQKFSDSSREALILHTKNKQIVDRVEEAATLTLENVTEEEMRKEYPQEWDTMSDFEKKMAKKAYVSDKRFSAVYEGVQETKKLDAWMEKVGEFANDTDIYTRYPEMLGRESKFKHFCSTATHIGVDLDILAAAFANKVAKEDPPKPNRKSLFNTTSGGDKTPGKPKEYSADEIKSLRENNFPMYEKLLRSGKLRIAE